jgi:hypothetical protein
VNNILWESGLVHTRLLDTAHRTEAITPISARPQDGLTLILEAPRSGTTWLAKIFDSNPQVLYRHEPDLSVAEDGIPVICDDVRPDGTCREKQSHQQVRCYIDKLAATRTLKSAGSLPVFPKAFDRRFGWACRSALVTSMLMARTVTGRSSKDIAMPWEFLRLDGPIRPHVVIKSVSALGRAGLFADALPEAQVILMLRSPLGQIASRLVGIAAHKFESVRFDKKLLATPMASDLGLTANIIDRASLVEKLAWEWAISNQKAMDDLACRPNARVVKYRNLVLDPERTARDLHEFCGLSWHPTTEAFIRRSVNFRGPDMYFHVYKNAHRPLEKWRTVLEPGDQSKILDIVRRTPLQSLWPEQFA